MQTPSIWFPIEAHTGMPFWFHLPRHLRQRLLERWQRKLPEWTEMVRGTTVLTKDALRHYFYDADIVTERVLGIPKSYIACRR